MEHLSRHPSADVSVTNREEAPCFSNKNNGQSKFLVFKNNDDKHWNEFGYGKGLLLGYTKEGLLGLVPLLKGWF